MNPPTTAAVIVINLVVLAPVVEVEEVLCILI